MFSTCLYVRKRVFCASLRVLLVVVLSALADLTRERESLASVRWMRGRVFTCRRRPGRRLLLLVLLSAWFLVKRVQ